MTHRQETIWKWIIGVMAAANLAAWISIGIANIVAEYNWQHSIYKQTHHD